MRVDKKLLGLLFVAILLVAQASFTSAQPEDDGDVEEEDPLLEEPQQEAKEPEVKKERPVYISPKPTGNYFLAEPFDNKDGFKKRWTVSSAKKDNTDEAIAKYDGVWLVEEPADNLVDGDIALILSSKARHNAVSTKLDKPYKFSGKPFVMQYEVRFSTGQDCGGAYVKLLTDAPSLSLPNFNDKTPYTIMFGPDKCGLDSKLHFIFRHKNPLNGKFEEKHAKKPSGSLDIYFTDKKTHLYTLVITTDNMFEIFVDQKLVNSGNLLEDMAPPVNPPKEIVDPSDTKPNDWDEREKIPDPDASKPEDWDESAPKEIEDNQAVKPEGWLDEEPELIPDPEAEKPTDWDDEMDGEWEAAMISNPTCKSAPGCGTWKRPMISNPEFKGKWKAPLIENPNYKGKWKPEMIPNPDYFEDLEPYKMTTIGAVGLELWSMSDGIIFDNFLITDDKKVADDFARDSWAIKYTEEEAQRSSKSVVQAVLDMTNERPWLWAVFILIVVLPIVLVIAYCCMSGSKSDEDAASRKKTDEPSPDDEVEEVEDAAAADGVNEEGAGGDTADAASGEGKNKKKEKKKAKKGDLEAENKEKESTEEEDGTETSTKTRKRKPRKD
ncbi:calnexin-like isoform X2 [Lineus longissimus]|uniref:calnexin-like isoform X2 n=1 Tax=Lineus longissimus TaxID=88925 RepID=UPI002B4EE9D2